MSSPVIGYRDDITAALVCVCNQNSESGFGESVDISAASVVGLKVLAVFALTPLIRRRREK